MDMYQDLHKWESSIRIAEQKNHPDIANLKQNYFQWLIDSGQEEKAGELKEEEGDFVSAINLYLKGGFPARAANVLTSERLTNNFELTERVASSLLKNSLYEKSGWLFEQIGRKDAALDAYQKGNCFRAAVELSRTSFPERVVKLEEVLQV
jgi:intraflagellar transport protein 172